MSAIMESLQDEVLDTIRDQLGVKYSANVLARKFDCGIPAMRDVLNELARMGKIRKTGTHSSVVFYSPTEHQLQIEREGLKSNWKPLTPRVAHAEMIKALRSVREANPSKFDKD